MQLSRQQQKDILRSAKRCSPSEISEKFDIPIEQINRLLQKKEPESDPIRSSKRRLDRIGIGSLAIFLIFGPLIPLALQTDGHDPTHLPQALFIQAGALALLGLWFLKGVINKDVRWQRTNLDNPIASFLLWAGISSLWALNHYECAVLFKQWTAAAIGFFVTVQLITTKDDVGKILRALAFSGFLVALIGITQQLFDYRGVYQAIPPASTFGNKNMAAHYIILTLPIALFLFIGNNHKQWHWFYLLLSLPMSIFLFYTVTKSAWLAFGIQLLFTFLLILYDRIKFQFIPPWNPTKSVLLILGLASCLLMINVDASGWHWRLGSVTEEIKKTIVPVEDVSDTPNKGIAEMDGARPLNSLRVRLGYWRNTIEMIKTFPFLGVGLGNFQIFYPLFSKAGVVDIGFSIDSVARFAHNDYLNIAAELGIIGVVLGGWLFSVVIGISWRLARKPAHAEDRHLFAAVVSSILGILVVSCFSFPLMKAVPSFTVMVLLGCLTRLPVPDRAADKNFLTKRKTVRLSLPVCAIGVGVVGISLLVFGKQANSIRQADIDYDQMVGWDRAGNAYQVIEKAREVVSNDPSRKQPLFYIGKATIELGDFESGTRVLEDYRRYYPYNLSALINLASGYFSFEEYDKAMELCEFIIETFPETSESFALKAQVMTVRGYPREAYNLYKKALTLGISKSEIFYNFGNIALTLGINDEARDAFQKSLAIRPNSHAFEALGLLVSDLDHDLENGLKYLEMALDDCHSEVRKQTILSRIATIKRQR